MHVKDKKPFLNFSFGCPGVISHTGYRGSFAVFCDSICVTASRQNWSEAIRKKF